MYLIHQETQVVYCTTLLESQQTQWFYEGGDIIHNEGNICVLKDNLCGGSVAKWLGQWT